MWVQFLGQEDLLEKEMATHSNILAWKIPRTEEPSRLQFVGLQRVGPERATAPDSSTLVWKIPWTEEPGGLQSMGSLRVGHD